MLFFLFVLLSQYFHNIPDRRARRLPGRGAFVCCVIVERGEASSLLLLVLLLVLVLLVVLVLVLHFFFLFFFSAGKSATIEGVLQ
jgi:hypothetical protein